MPIHIPVNWMSFCIATAFVVLFSYIMHIISRSFITRDVLHKKFGILDLELASSELELNNLLHGITKLEAVQAKKVFRALRMHLYVDFLFMPAAYGALFIACMQVARKMPESGMIFFSILAWLQVAAWVSDIIENIFLLKKIRQHEDQPLQNTGTKFFAVFQKLQFVKWGAALLALVCILSSLMYFWVSGFYSPASLKYIVMFTAEILVFIILCALPAKKSL